MNRIEFNVITGEQTTIPLTAEDEDEEFTAALAAGYLDDTYTLGAE